MSFEPLRITARLGSPVVGDPTLPLDGVLFALAYGEHKGRLGGIAPHDQGAIEPPMGAEPGKAPEYDPEIVPLQIIDRGGQWFYAASFAQWGAYTEDIDYWRKRFDDQLSDLTYADSVMLGKGRYKSQNTSLPYRHALSLTWFCVGERKHIHGMLRHRCHALGRKAAYGWGRVLEWTIEPFEHDWSLFDAEDKPMRALPFDWFGKQPQFRFDAPLGRRAFRPPYWSKDNEAVVVVP